VGICTTSVVRCVYCYVTGIVGRVYVTVSEWGFVQQMLGNVLYQNLKAISKRKLTYSNALYILSVVF
jgi:DNA repair photolyase